MVASLCQTSRSGLLRSRTIAALPGVPNGTTPRVQIHIASAGSAWLISIWPATVCAGRAKHCWRICATPVDGNERRWAKLALTISLDEEKNMSPFLL